MLQLSLFTLPSAQDAAVLDRYADEIERDEQHDPKDWDVRPDGTWVRREPEPFTPVWLRRQRENGGKDLTGQIRL